MASIAKQCFLLFLLTLLFSVQIHARESQFFNKVPSNNGEKKNKQEQEQDPTFVPENENGGHGLYGHESGQLSPTTTTPTNEETYKTTRNLPYNGEPRESYPKYLPKNYNTQAYVTEPEGYRGEFDNKKNPNFYKGDNTYYNNDQEQGLGETKFVDKSYTTNPNHNGYYYNNNNNNNFYNGEQQGMSDTRFNGNYYNGEEHGLSGTRLNSNSFYTGEQEGLSDARFNTNNNNNRNYYNHNVGNLNGVQKQGMSDTRFLENGKYFYDTSLEQKSNRGLYASNNNRGFYGNPDNSFEFNNNYQNQEQFQNFQDEEDLP